MLPPRTYRGMTVLGGGGALGVSACDAAEENGLYFPALTGTIYENIYAALPKPGSSAVNPIDVANPFVPPQTLSQVMQEAAKDERVDIQVQITLFYHFKQMVKRLKLGTLKEIVPVDQYVKAAYEAKEKRASPSSWFFPIAARNRPIWRWKKSSASPGKASIKGASPFSTTCRMPCRPFATYPCTMSTNKRLLLDGG